MKTASLALLSLAGTAIAQSGPGQYTTYTTTTSYNPYNAGEFSHTPCPYEGWYGSPYGWNRWYGWQWFPCYAPITNTISTTINCVSGQYATANSCETCSSGQFSNPDTSGCEQCPIGKFETSSRASCSNCDVGEQGNAGRTGCEACPAGTFTLVAGNGCDPHQLCGPGQGVDGANLGTRFQDNTCVTCDATAPVSQFSDISSGSHTLGTCQDHANCPIGEGSSFDVLTNMQDSNCQPCDPTTSFSASSSPGACATKSLRCATGKRYQLNGRNQDSTCPPCTGTTFNDDDGVDPVCHDKIQVCNKGTALSVYDNTQDNQCEPCPAGHFQDQDGAAQTIQCQPKQMTCAIGEWMTYSSDATANNYCSLCDAMPGATADGAPTAEWASTDLQTDAKCPWKCKAGFEETHGSTRCSEPGANIKLKAGQADSEGKQTQITLTAHKNGVIKLAGVALGSTSPSDICLEANLCGATHSAGGSAAVHTQTASHTRRLAEMDTWKDEIGARMAAIEAKLGM